MGTPEFLIMNSHDGIIIGGEGTVREVVLEPLVIPEFVHVREESPVQEADLALLIRFDIACGEVKYFKPDTVIPKPAAPTLESSVKPKSVSPKRCTCAKLHDEDSGNCRRPEEFHLEQSQLTARSDNLLAENADQLTMLSGEGERSSTPATSVADNVVDSPFLEEDGRNISTPDVAGSRDGSSFSEIDEGSIVDDDSSNLSTSLDSSNPCTPAGESRDSPTASFIPGNSAIETFSDNLELKEEKSSKASVLVAVNSKRKYQHLLNSESRSNSCTPKSRELSSSQLSILVDDDEADVAEDAEERRKSLISAAKAADLPKFKWGDLDLEDLDNMQAVSKNGNIDTTCATSFEEFREDEGLDAQEIAPPDIEQELRGFDSLGGEKEQSSVFSPGQQTDFPGFVVPHSDLQEEVVAVAVQTSIKEVCTGNEGEDLFAKSSEATKLGADIIVAETPCESLSSSGLALLVMGEVDFRLSPIVDGLHSAEVKKLSEVADIAGKPIISHNRRAPEQIIGTIEFSYRKQLKEYRNLG